MWSVPMALTIISQSVQPARYTCSEQTMPAFEDKLVQPGMTLLAHGASINLSPASPMVTVMAVAEVYDRLLDSLLSWYDGSRWIALVLGSVCYLFCSVEQPSRVHMGTTTPLPLPTTDIAELITTSTSDATMEYQFCCSQSHEGARHLRNMVAPCS